MDESRKLSSGTLLTFEKVYPLDAVYDTYDAIPEDVRTNKRYKDIGDCSIGGVAARLVQDFGDKPLDIVVHSLANGPEVKKALIDVSREGYLAAISASAYSLISMVSRFGPIMRPGGSFVSMTYLASERVIPGYGGGMSSAKAALESDTRTLAFGRRRFGCRVNTTPAFPLASRAASAIGHREDGRVRGEKRAITASPLRKSDASPRSCLRRWRGDITRTRRTWTRAPRHGYGRAPDRRSRLNGSVYAIGPFDLLETRRLQHRVDARKIHVDGRSQLREILVQLDRQYLVDVTPVVSAAVRALNHTEQRAMQLWGGSGS
jgi:enoyl-[acyl-carrier-protein] reductase (NADH)